MVASIPTDSRDRIVRDLELRQTTTGYEWRNHVKALADQLERLSRKAEEKAIELRQQLASGKLETYVANPLGEIQGTGLSIDLECANVQRIAVEYIHLTELRAAIVTELESPVQAAVTKQLTKNG
jgi:hypothetical protein